MNSSPTLLFNPTRASDEELERTFVGRSDLLRKLREDIAVDKGRATTRHWQIIAPRGAGKSHITELLGRRLSREDGWEVVRLPEEHYQVGTVGDLLEQIVERIAKSGSPLEGTRDSDTLVEHALDWLRDWKDQTGKSLLVILENLGMLLGSQLKNKREQARLREILMVEPPFTLLATSTSYVDSTLKHDAPFYDFFQSIRLPDLTRAEVAELVEARAVWNNDEIIRSQIAQVREKLDAIYHLSGGNPRLVLALYSILRRGVTGDLHDQLLKLLDEVTPYFQAKLADLSPQMARVLTALALAPGPLTPAQIGKKCRLSTNQITANITRLERERVVSAGARPDRKRRYYEVSDRLFRIWVQMREGNSSQRRLHFLVEFFQSWYHGRPEELHDTAERLAAEFWEELSAEHYGRCADHLLTLGYLERSLPSGVQGFFAIEHLDGKRSEASGNHDEIIARLIELVETTSVVDDRVVAGLMLARVYREDDRSMEAAGVLRRLISERPQPVMLGTAWDLYLACMGDVGEGEAAYREGAEAVLRDSDLVSLNRTLALMALGQECHAQAIDHLKAYVGGENCPSCSARLMLMVGLSLDRADSEKQEAFLDVARDFTRTESQGQEEAALRKLVEASERDRITGDGVIAAATAWESVDDIPPWHALDFACAVLHDERYISNAFAYLSRAAGAFPEDSILHTLYLLVHAIQYKSDQTDEILSYLAKIEEEDVAKLFSSMGGFARAHSELRAPLLGAYERLRATSAIDIDLPPYAAALRISKSADPKAGLDELHPEEREAVEMLLGEPTTG